MKRATSGGKRGSRKKQQPQDNVDVIQESDSQEEVQQSPKEHAPVTEIKKEPKRRSLTPAEVALTQKNYRLAKELTEVRARLRDECKTVSRLTIENVSQCNSEPEDTMYLLKTNTSYCHHFLSDESCFKMQRGN